jgi:hypothetical protein
MRLSWDGIGERYFKAGLDHGVLYPLVGGEYGDGVAWNGLSGVDDNTGGHEASPLYNNDRKRAIVFTPSEIGGTIKCYTYPDEFEPCIGNIEVVDGLFLKGQTYLGFGFCYRTKIGNDVVGANLAYELHLIYNAVIVEAKENAATIGGETKANEFAFDFESLEEDFSYGDPVAHFVINSRFVDPDKLLAVEDILYGTELSPPRLILPDELYDMLNASDSPDIPNGYPHDSRYPADSMYPVEPN